MAQHGKQIKSDSTLSVESLRFFVRQVLVEQMETAYNDYHASQDDIMKRLRMATEPEMEMRFPKFVDHVAKKFHEIENHEGLSKTKWLFMRSTFDKTIPYAILPSGERRVVFWDANIDDLKAADDYELVTALMSFGDRTSAY